MNTGNKKYRIRKLTPRECWALQGFSFEDCDMAIDLGVSNTQLYKQAGNGIITNCVELMFEHLYKAQVDDSYECYDENFTKADSKNADPPELIKVGQASSDGSECGLIYHEGGHRRPSLLERMAMQSDGSSQFDKLFDICYCIDASYWKGQDSECNTFLKRKKRQLIIEED